MAMPSDDHKQLDQKPGDRRHVYGPRAMAAVLPPLLRPAFKRRSPAASRIMTDWEAMVGPALAAMTAPRRLSAGVLLIGCAGPVALELQHLSDQLAARINTYLGSPAVSRIRLVQERHVATPVRLAYAPSAKVIQAAEDAVAGLPPGPLRESLARLGQRVLALRA